jgi:cellulose synthase/poly-beta-1,6-N-acetylglucosamine synthase-like glycosyltransferase
MLGVMAKVDGPCVAYRKSLWSPISEFEDIDQIVALEATKKGYRAVMVPDAVCTDSANASVQQELRARRRMTRKAVLSTNKRWRPGDVVRHPFFSFALYSHKFVRFLSPVFFLAFLVCLLILALDRGLLPLGLILLALAGLLVYLNERVFGITALKEARGRLLSFLVANLGFAYGLVDWLRGVKKGRYVPTRQTGGT